MTAYERPTPQDFAYANVGSLHLRTVAVQAPDHVAQNGRSYASGAAVPITLVIVNAGSRSDTLRNITSPAFTGWGVYPTAQVVAAAGGSSASSSSSSSSSSSAPASSTSASSPSASGAAASGSLSPSSTSSSISAPAATSVTIPPQESVQLGVVNLTGSDTRTGTDVSANTVVLTGLHGSKYAPLFPAMVVPITFVFAHAGSATLSVPVQLTAPAPGETVPSLQTIANGG